MARINSSTPWAGVELFAQREARRMDRLVKAAYGVGATHAWFRKLDRASQEAKVREWVEEALEAAEERRARSAAAAAGRVHA
ncbi:MAG: hypothetical protein RI988_8 [Pseudomonadota bacterium]|jgi:hypothetical protein